ncbi:acetyl-CoA acetyltransferase [Acidobacteria bacterium Mor1]|nr:acetyl-CoA acetyltransferase [Acidobacteria bacterium Mor1]
MSSEIVIAGAVRTPIGKFGGGLAGVGAAALGTHAAKAALSRAGIAPDAVDHTVFGHARQAGCGPNGARQVSVAAGIPVERPAMTINQACLSGLQAVMSACRLIRTGEADVVLAGGMENMSQVPHLLFIRDGQRMGPAELIDAMYRDGFDDPISGKRMGQTAETLAERYSIGRDEQDAFAAESQRRAQTARETGLLDAEIEPITLETRKGPVTIARDEHPRDGVTADGLGKLKPVFAADGSVTAGNSCGITDGAAAMVVLSSDAAKRLGVQPMARIAGHRTAGVDPAIMGIGPVPATRELMEAAGRKIEEVDLIELNEAFAAQALAVDRELHFDRDKLNVHGGAIALGHPIGASGARILVTLLHAMEQRSATSGLATLCVSGGLGGSLLVER